MRIFSESPLDRRDHTNRLSCHIIHEFRFSRIDFCSAARCRQRAGESGSYDPPRAFTGISRVHSTATVAHRALTRRIILHANLRLPRVGFRPAARRRQCARIRRRKEARRASVRAKTTSTTRPALSRESPASTRPPRSRAPCPRSARRIARESSSPARRPSRGYTLPPVRPNPPSEGSAQAKAAPTTRPALSR